MESAGSPIRNISDTAHWVAVYRANESERADAVFRDPFARRLAGDRGHAIHDASRFSRRAQWPFVARTFSFDQIILEQVRGGADMVVNLAAGLDARPYRLSLPRSLQWVEIDLPGILDYKEKMLANETPVCALERIRLDLADESARCDVFDSLARRATRALIVSEGLLVYLATPQVASLARDLALHPAFTAWLAEVASPGLLRMMQRQFGKHLEPAGAPMQFAPPEGPEFFSQFGWKPTVVRSMLQTARMLKRLPFLLRVLSVLPEPRGPAGNRPWSGVCLLERTS